MADDPDDIDDIDDEDETEGEEKPKMSLMKKGLFFGLPVLILILGGVAAFLLLSGGGEEEVELVCDEHGEHCVAPEVHVEEVPEEVYYYYLQEEGEDDGIMVNIRSSDGRPLLLRLRVAFESTDPELGPVLHEHLEPVMDQFITFLSELREDDLYGSAGTHRVRLELLRRVNLVIEPARVDQVRIQEFMIAN